jgi:hypothetical protein
MCKSTKGKTMSITLYEKFVRWETTTEEWAKERHQSLLKSSILEKRVFSDGIIKESGWIFRFVGFKKFLVSYVINGDRSYKVVWAKSVKRASVLFAEEYDYLDDVEFGVIPFPKAFDFLEQQKPKGKKK